jgi:hypothetical protein
MQGGPPSRRCTSGSNGNTARMRSIVPRIDRARPERQAQTVGDTYFTIGTAGRRRLTARATRRLKSGTSIRTSTSGGAAVIAAAVSRSRRRMVGSLARMGAMPITVRSCAGNRLESPAAIIRSPPTPRNDTAPPCWRPSACIRPAPSRSPEDSPATKNTSRRGPRAAAPPLLTTGLAPHRPDRPGRPQPPRPGRLRRQGPRRRTARPHPRPSRSPQGRR